MTQKHYARRHRNSLVDDLVAILKDEADRFVVTAGNMAEQIIRQTLKYSTQFGAGGAAYVGGGRSKYPGFRDADVQVESQVSVSRRKGVKIELFVTVIDPSGKPHFVWHLISEGRRAFTQKKTSPPIRMRRGRRTKPNTLDVSGFPGYSGKVVVIHKGTRVKEIEGTQWYRATQKEFQVRLDALSENSLLKAYGIKFKSGKIRRFTR